MKGKEKIKTFIEEYRNVLKYEKTQKTYYKVMRVICVILCTILMILIAGKSCKPNTMLKADTYNSNIDFNITKVSEIESIEYYGTTAIITPDINATQWVFSITLRLQPNRNTNYSLTLASNKELVLFNTTSTGMTIDAYGTEPVLYNSAYVYATNSQGTYNINTSNGTITISFGVEGSEKIALDYYLFETGNITIDRQLRQKYNNTIYSRINGFLQNASEQDKNMAYAKGYEQALADSSEGGLGAIMRTIFDYPINFFNKLLDFDYKGFWVGQLFYIVVFLGLGFIVIKTLF